MASDASKFVAGGVIRPSRIVKMSGSYDQTVLEADANERAFGISQTGTDEAPGLSGASTNAASADGDVVMVYTIGQRAPLTAGSGGWTRGGMIKSDADGNGVAAAVTGTTLQWVIAIAEESCAAGETGYVRIIGPLPYYPALA